MKLNGSGIWLLIGLAAGSAGGYFVAAKYGSSCKSCCPSPSKELALNQAMRKLWADHVIWTRQYIVAAVADTPDVQAATIRLLKNQDDIGGAIKAFYGSEAGDKLAALLKDHILIAAELIKQAKADNKEQFKEVDARWHKNADDIATFLSGANPNWPFEDLKNMLYEHLKITTQEVVYRLEENWTEDIKQFDIVFDQAMHMADDLAAGIMKQFPDKF